MATVQDVLDYARNSVNDTSSNRYTDAVGLKYANYACSRMLEIRPDLRMGTATSSGQVAGGFGYGPWIALAATSSFPFGPEYEAKVANFVVYGWQSSDDPFVNDQLAAASYQMYLKELLGA